jgi:hypothetical protein
MKNQSQPQRTGAGKPAPSELSWLLRLLVYSSLALIVILIIQASTGHPVPSSSPVAEPAPKVASDEYFFKQQVTEESNVQSAGSSDVAPAPVAPDEDLLLAGMVGVGSEPRAFFEVTRPGEVISNFTLREQEQNEWLQVLSIDPQNGTVNAILKRPVVRIRNVGAEVVLSFKVHGKSTF